MVQALVEHVEQQRASLRQAGLAEADLPFFRPTADFHTACLLLHGSAASPCNNRLLAQHLLDMGYAVHAPLLAGHHDLKALQRGETTWLDCLAGATEALDQLKAYFEQVYVIGSSFGGTLAYLLGVQYPEKLKGVVALSAPAMEEAHWQPQEPWMQQVKEAIAAAAWHLQHLHLPTLVMHGLDDPHVVVAHALQAYPRIAAQRKKLSLHQGIGHALGFGFNTPEVAEEIRLFIAQTHAPVRWQLHLADHGYHEVALAGEFTAWQPSIKLQRDAHNNWTTELRLQPGCYQYKLVIDGQWVLHPEAEHIVTPHGDTNAVLRIRADKTTA